MDKITTILIMLAVAAIGFILTWQHIISLEMIILSLIVLGLAYIFGPSLWQRYTTNRRLPHPTTAQDYYDRAVIHGQQGHYDQAIADFNQAIAIQPDYTAAYFCRARAYMCQRAYDEAIAGFTQTLTLQPDHATAHNDRGAAYASKRDYAHAIADYTRAIDLNPDLPEAYRNLGHALRRVDRPAEGIPLLQKSQEMKPHVHNIGLLAGAYKQLGDTTNALHYAAQARALLPPDDWYDLACLEAISDNTDTALEYLRRAARQPACNPIRAETDPDFNGLRHDPRFAEILNTIAKNQPA